MTGEIPPFAGITELVPPTHSMLRKAKGSLATGTIKTRLGRLKVVAESSPHISSEQIATHVASLSTLLCMRQTTHQLEGHSRVTMIGLSENPPDCSQCPIFVHNHLCPTSQIELDGLPNHPNPPKAAPDRKVHGKTADMPRKDYERERSTGVRHLIQFILQQRGRGFTTVTLADKFRQFDHDSRALIDLIRGCKASCINEDDEHFSARKSIDCRGCVFVSGPTCSITGEAAVLGGSDVKMGTTGVNILHRARQLPTDRYTCDSGYLEDVRKIVARLPIGQ